MTTINLRELGFRRPTSHPHLEELIEWINKQSLSPHVVLDLRGCTFSYSLALIIEAIVNNLTKYTENKKITINHGYATVTKNHLVNYITKKTNLNSGSIKTIEELQFHFKNRYNLDIIIEGK